MSLATIMLEQLVAARRVIEDGHELGPAWRINTAEGTFLILTRFDTDKDEHRERTLFLISRFMVWKMTTSFVLTAPTWLGREDAVMRLGSPLAFRVTSASRSCSDRRGDAAASANPCGWHRTTSTISILPCCPRVLRSAQEADKLARLRKNGELRAGAVELRPAVAQRKKGPFPERKRPQGCRLGPCAPRGVPMDEREVHRLDAGWRESVTEA
jgi:hypothetical protein